MFIDDYEPDEIDLMAAGSYDDLDDISDFADYYSMYDDTAYPTYDPAILDIFRRVEADFKRWDAPTPPHSRSRPKHRRTNT